jgi:hypothetical protein
LSSCSSTLLFEEAWDCLLEGEADMEVVGCPGYELPKVRPSGRPLQRDGRRQGRSPLRRRTKRIVELASFAREREGSIRLEVVSRGRPGWGGRWPGGVTRNLIEELDSVCSPPGSSGHEYPIRATGRALGAPVR